MMAQMTAREYAKARGISHTAVNKAIKSGRLSAALVSQEGRSTIIDSDVADREWPRGEKEIMRDQYAPKAGEDRVTVDKVASTYQQSRAAREAFQAKLAKLEFEQKSGKVVNAEEVRAEAFKIARFVRDAMLNIPDRLAAELAAENDQFKVHARLTQEIRRALVSLGEES